MQVFMQIYVMTFSNKTLVLNVAPSDTIAQVKQKASDMSQTNDRLPAGSFDLMLRSGKILKDENTLNDYNITDFTTLLSRFITKPPDYDPEVLPYLKEALRELETESGVFIFIGLGCYDHSHGEESIKQQQCPVDVLKACKTNKLKLRVLLIDPDFSASGGELQIYDIDKNWQLNKTELNGKYKEYKYQSRDFKLCTFATTIPSDVYGGQDKTLAGFNLEKLGAHAVSNGSTLLVGNFYAKDNPPHVAMGDVTLLSQLGYIKKDSKKDKTGWSWW